ncbi:MAG TPA: nucleoside-diphosphate sugar epimerase [Sedimenticola thiotaurini]|uniref:Nucleoside-diphosphate sugar epimerase n=1 Tax=Sedimenticola thiotaurini TaxID=1543721 RepID=A0A831RQA3_9GAMM|nr:nucleoside-diphosphate sugar epimerase [Sedimenticola thiotaurini]
MVVWRLTDGKPGHESQSRGLVQALARQRPLQCHDIPVAGGAALPDLLRRRFPAGAGLPAPDLLIGAGHATHLPLLAARRARGGRSVVLMRPSLPAALFDLCLIPEHDRPRPRDNVLTTRGVLNDLTGDGPHHADRALVLVGGPSRHHRWDQEGLLQRLARLFAARPGIRFTVTTSRRTPPAFIPALERLSAPNCRVVPLDRTGPGWVARHLGESAEAWVTGDSVSMLYEALTAGCRVGLLPLPASGDDRITRGVAQLLAEGWVGSFDQALAGDGLPPARSGFNEARRCADSILQRWPRL